MNVTATSRNNNIGILYSVTFTIPSNLSSCYAYKYTDSTKDYWITDTLYYIVNGETKQLTSRSEVSVYIPDPDNATVISGEVYPARFRYANNKIVLEVTKNAYLGVDFYGWSPSSLACDEENATEWWFTTLTLADIITVKSGYTSSPTPGSVSISNHFANNTSNTYTVSGVTPYKSVSTTKTISFPSKEYYSFKSGINDLVKNNFSFQYTSSGSTTTLNSSYITVSDVSGSQYNKNVTITQTVTNPVSTIDTDFANGILVPNTGVKLSTFYNTGAYNMASLNVAVTLTKSGNTFTVNSLPNPIWQYISSFALNVPVQAGGFSGTCTAFAQTGPFVNNYTVSYSGTITTWNQSVTSSMNQICSISYSYQVSGNNTSSSKTFTVDRYYGYVTSSTHLRMGVNFTGSSSLLYQSTAPTVEQLSSTSEIRSVTRI